MEINCEPKPYFWKIIIFLEEATVNHLFLHFEVEWEVPYYPRPRSNKAINPSNSTMDSQIQIFYICGLFLM